MKGKMPPKLMRFFWKTVIVIAKTCYMLSNRRHCWTHSCHLYFCRVHNEGNRRERQNMYRVWSSRNLASKLSLRLMGQQIQNCKPYIWNKTIGWKPSRFPTFLCIYSKSMSSKRCGIKIKLKTIFSPIFELLHTLAMISRTLADAIHTHYKIRRQAKILKTKTVIISKPHKIFKNWIQGQSFKACWLF